MREAHLWHEPNRDLTNVTLKAQSGALLTPFLPVVNILLHFLLSVSSGFHSCRKLLAERCGDSLCPCCLRAEDSVATRAG